MRTLFSPLIPEETDVLDTIQALPGRLILTMRAQLDGKDVAVIAASHQEHETGDYLITPLAIVINDDLLSRLRDSDGTAPTDFA